MKAGQNARIAYYNGKYLPEGDIRLPFRDKGFLYGDAVFDMTRTFGGDIFRIEEHVGRLYDSLRAMQIEPGIAPDEMVAISHEVLARNAHLLGPDTDYWVAQRVSRGLADVGDEGWEQPGATLIVECRPLPLAERAPFYRDGVDVVISPIRRTSPDALTPRAKTHNYLNLIMAGMALPPDSGYPILLDHNGNLAEGLGANIFLVRDGVCLTPREQFVLPGVSRQVVFDLCAQLGIEHREQDLDFHDAANANEIFLTSTSMCIAPVKSFNARTVGHAPGPVPGPVTRRLMDAYVELVGFDWVAQYRAYL